MEVVVLFEKAHGKKGLQKVIHRKHGLVESGSQLEEWLPSSPASGNRDFSLDWPGSRMNAYHDITAFQWAGKE